MSTDSQNSKEVAETLPPRGASVDTSPPDGGFQAWMTIAGGWLFYFCGLGFFNSYGWIGSFEIALQFLLGIPVGIAFDAGYFHHLMIGGSLIYCFSLFMVSLAKPGQYYQSPSPLVWSKHIVQIFLAQGVGMGLGLAATFLPALTVVAHHFSHRRGFAIGIMTSGASIGGLVFPIMLNKLIFGTQGFAIGVRATAGVITGLLCIANFLVRTRPQAQVDGGRLGFKRGHALALFKDVPYMTFVLSFVYGDPLPVFYLQLFSTKHGINANLAFYVISFINAGGFFGRLIPNYLTDKIGSYNVLIPTSFACSAFVFAILGIRNAAGAIVVALLYGAMNGAHISVTPAVLSDLSIDVGEVG
ncbi:hypothetical protein H0H92_002611 [Tricholoma furcatifolium]|nr:hypothetical protein H0H92_002611 [Tricholoma furcatifolium]